MTAAALWLNTTFASFDLSIASAVHKFYDLAGGFFTPFLEFVSFLGNGGICLLIAAGILILFKDTRKYGTAMLLGIMIGALFTNLFLKIVIARPRPYVDEASLFHQIWLVMGQHMESDKSFPSGHTTAAFAAMVPIFLVGNKRISWTALIFAFMMGLSRIYLMVHYPSDVLGGMLVGSFAGILGTIVAYKLPQIWYELVFLQKKTGKHERR